MWLPKSHNIIGTESSAQYVCYITALLFSLDIPIFFQNCDAHGVIGFQTIMNRDAKRNDMKGGTKLSMFKVICVRQRAAILLLIHLQLVKAQCVVFPSSDQCSVCTTNFQLCYTFFANIYILISFATEAGILFKYRNNTIAAIFLGASVAVI